MTFSSSTENHQFILAVTEYDYEIARTLFLEYAESLDFDLCFQNFEDELAQLNLMYNKPSGGIILVKDAESNEFAGCAGIRKSESRIAELKRMYVREAHRRKGLGEQLLILAIELASRLKYEKIRLDTLKSMTSAIRLYQAKGFKLIEPYRFNPDKDALFFELVL